MLIAEIGNNHCGNFEKAKLMIDIACDSGADLIKGQAFVASDIKSGSMPLEFYKICQFNLDQYIELIYFARDIGIEMFYTIYSDTLNDLLLHQKYFKYSASQTFKRDMMSKDSESVFMSISNCNELPEINRANVFFVNEYLCENTNFNDLDKYVDKYLSRAGLSDHSKGIDVCIEAIEDHGVQLIEKHFVLDVDLCDIVFKGKLFRDSVHSATPDQLIKIKDVLCQSMKRDV